MRKKQIKEIVQRMIALAILKVTGILAGGAILGVDPWISGAIAAIVAGLQVAGDLARAYVVNGMISDADIDLAFEDSADAPVVKKGKK